MENTLKHKGKALVGAILFGIAVIGSAFIGKTEDKGVKDKTEKTVTAPAYLVNKGSTFSPRATVDVGENCNDSNPKYCVYVPTEEGMTEIPNQTSYSPTEIDYFISQGWLAPHPSSRQALYLN